MKKKIGLILAIATHLVPTMAFATTVIEQAPAYNTGLMQQRVEDFRVAVMGGYITWQREFSQGRWAFNAQWANLHYGDLRTVEQSKPKGKEQATTGHDKTVLLRNGYAYRLDRQAAGRIYRYDVNKYIEQTDDGFIWHNRDDDWIRYDHDGFIVAYGQGALATATFVHNAANQLVAVNDRHGQTVLTLDYVDDRLVAVVDRVGRAVRYQWQGAALVAVTDVNGQVWRYTYDTFLEKASNIETEKSAPYALASFTDPENRTWIFTNAVVGGEVVQLCADRGPQWRLLERQIGWQDEPSVVQPLAQTPTGVVTIEKSVLPGTENCQAFTIPRQMITQSVTGPDGHTQRYAYAYHQAQQAYYQLQIDATGRKTQTFYGSDGAVTQVRIDDQTVIRRVRQGDTLFIQDQAVQQQTKSDQINPKFNINSELNITPKPNNPLTTVTLNRFQQPIKVTHFDGHDTVSEYHPQRNVLTRQVDKHGIITMFSYDDAGLLTQKISAYGLPEQRTVDYRYNSDKLLSQAIYQGGQSHHVVKYDWVYDPMGNVVKTVINDAITWEYRDYTVTGQPQTVIDGRGKTWKFRYDPVSRLTAEMNPNKQEKTYQYDNVGNLRAIVDENQLKTQFTYNGNDQLVTVIHPDDTMRSYHYEADVLVAITHEDGERIAVPVEPVGHPRLSDSLEGDQVHRYQHAFLDTPTQIVDDANRAVDMEYDPWGRLVRQAREGLGVWTWQYDGNGNVTRVADSNRSVIDFVYDDANQLRQEKWYTATEPAVVQGIGRDTVEGTVTPDSTVAYRYDKTGRLRSWSVTSGRAKQDGAHGKTRTRKPTNKPTNKHNSKLAGVFTHDKQGRITSETVDFGPFSKRYQYRYYADGMLQTLIMPDGREYHYDYDDRNRVTRVKLPGEGAITVRGYHGDTLPTEEMLPGGVVRKTRYTHQGKPLRVTLENAYQQPILTLGDTPSVGHALNSGLWRLESLTQGMAHNVLEMNYLSTGQLSQRGEITYQYDAQGNLIQQRINHQHRATPQDMPQEKTSATREAGSERLPDRALTYDARDRLIAVVENTASHEKPITTHYRYDPFDRRVSKTINRKGIDGETTYYLYNDVGLLAEYDQKGNVLRSYGYRPTAKEGDMPLFVRVPNSTSNSNPSSATDDAATVDIGTYYYYHADPQGTPYALTDRTGQVVWSLPQANNHYSENPHSDSSRRPVTEQTVENNIRRAGRYYDHETGLHYSQARYYDPEIGRYTTPDRHAFTTADNLYTETGNDTGIKAQSTTPKLPLGLNAHEQSLHADDVLTAFLGDAHRQMTLHSQPLGRDAGEVSGNQNLTACTLAPSVMSSTVLSTPVSRTAQVAASASVTEAWYVDPEQVVYTEAGLTPITAITVGERVLSLDKWSGQESYQPVTGILTRPQRHEYVVLSLANGDNVTVSPEQTFYVSPVSPLSNKAYVGAGISDSNIDKNKDKAPAAVWMTAGDLNVGDGLHMQQDSTTAVVNVARKITHSTRYSLDVANTHTFFVGKNKQLIDRIALDSRVLQSTASAPVVFRGEQVDRMASKAQVSLINVTIN
ncbi:RHS repeat-associated core domain-containing protein [Photobacterium japonica]|uniref:RHS repeat-associated core domain-containing protein n=1 Tax=Photobacterium japonica TaxID=2910235 RepID=UPI003D0C668F